MNLKLKKTIILILILGVLLIAGFYFSKKPENLIETENTEVVVEKGTEIIYTNPENNQTLKVLYDNEKNTASIYSREPDEIILNATTSASGAKYENIERGIVLWSKEKEVSLYLNESLIFSGVEQ